MYIKQQNENYNLVKAMKKLEEENHLLKSSMRKEMLLQEQLSSLEQELASANVIAKEKVNLENEILILRSQLNSWVQMSCKIDAEVTTPYRLETFVRQLQNTLLELKNENSIQKIRLVG